MLGSPSSLPVLKRVLGFVVMAAPAGATCLAGSSPLQCHGVCLSGFANADQVVGAELLPERQHRLMNVVTIVQDPLKFSNISLSQVDALSSCDDGDTTAQAR